MARHHVLHFRRLLAAQVNVDGRSELRLFDARSRKERPTPALPPGSVRALGFHPQAGELAVSLDSAKGPSDVWSLDPNAAKGAAPVQWTRALAAPGVEPQTFGDQQIVRWKSFDGRSISGLLSLPPERFAGKRPVLIDIHGGPEGQAKVGFMGRANHFIEDLGIAIVQPNVRGSSGYGKTFLALDNGMKREDSVKDIGALLDWTVLRRVIGQPQFARDGGHAQGQFLGGQSPGCRRGRDDDFARRREEGAQDAVDVLVPHDADDETGGAAGVPAPEISGERRGAVGIVGGVEQHLFPALEPQQFEPRRPGRAGQ